MARSHLVVWVSLRLNCFFALSPGGMRPCSQWHEVQMLLDLPQWPWTQRTSSAFKQFFLVVQRWCLVTICFYYVRAVWKMFCWKGCIGSYYCRTGMLIYPHCHLSFTSKCTSLMKPSLQRNWLSLLHFNSLSNEICLYMDDIQRRNSKRAYRWRAKSGNKDWYWI